MTIDIGFVGLSAGRSWADVSHLPGLRSIEQSPYKITGVGLQNRKSPTLIKAKELIGSDAIGRVISTNFKCQRSILSGRNWF